MNVSKGGLEPPRPCGHQPLKLARLPNSATSTLGPIKLAHDRFQFGLRLRMWRCQRGVVTGRQRDLPRQRPRVREAPVEFGGLLIHYRRQLAGLRALRVRMVLPEEMADLVV